jgi:sec-independent protein translocase protein TatB
MLQFGEVVIILLLALVLVGPKRLPEVARKLGGWVAEFRAAARELTEGIESEITKAVAPLDDVKRDIQTSLESVDPTRYEWTGPKGSAGPSPEEALEDLEQLEEREREPGAGE